MRKKCDEKDAALFALLNNSFAAEEIHQLLTGSLLSLDAAGFERLIERLDEKTGKTVRRVMDSYGKGITESKPVPGRAKIRQEWDRAISDWQDCLYESGDEDGKYVIQENHWEAPYLDTSALAGDLEEIAARMRPMIPRVIDEDIDPEFDFFELAKKTVEEIGSGLPEWMDSWDDGHFFCAEVTGCLLEWAWRKFCTNQKQGAAFEFIDEVRELVSSDDKIQLDEDAVVGFVLDLNKDCQREILSGIEENRASPEWQQVLDSVHSGWFLLHKELLKRWSKLRHAEICRENIQKDWKLALPVLEELLEKGAFDEASSVAEEALQRLLALSKNEIWDPTKELLICRPRPYFFSSTEDAVTRLFELWAKTAGGLGRKELSAALDLQAIMVTKWKDWDKVFSKLEKTSSTGFVALVDRFFMQWKNFAAAKTEKHIPGNDWRVEWSWVPILADEARAKQHSSKRFHKSMRDWLKEAGQSPDNMKRVRYSLERLTLDLNCGSAVRKTSPTLHRILSSGYGGGDLLDQSRKRWLKRLDAQELFPDVMAVLKKGIVYLVPDPADSHKSRYDSHAEWLKVLFELNSDEYEQLVKGWKVIHGRRSNLWKAVSEQGLPVPGKR